MRPIAVLLLFFYTQFCVAQDGKFSLGARNSGLAGTSSTLGDHWSLFNNIGGLGKIEHSAVFADYQNRYGIKEFQVVGAGAVYTTGKGNAGLGFYKFGDEIFSQQRLHLAFGHRLQLISLGLGVDFLQYNIATVGTRQVVTLQFGGIAEITPELHFGAHISNFNQARLVKETREKVPTVMKGGISYRPNSELMINLEVEKDLDFDEVVKAGIEYKIVEQVFLRTGISTRSGSGAFGIGFHPTNFQFDYAYSTDPKLGGIHEVSFSILSGK